MKTIETIAKRCSCRAYRPEQITPEELKQLLQAANAAPVGMAKYETLKISVVQSRELLAEIDQEGAKFFGDPSMHPLYGAPTLIVISGFAADSDEREVSMCNASCLIENMHLAATELGLGSVYIRGCINAIRENRPLCEKLGVPEDFVLTGAIAVGYPCEEPETRELVTDKIETVIL